MQLFDYQEDALLQTRRAFASGRRRVLLVSPTGSGKTVIASEIVQGAIAKGNQVLFVAHRGELIGQTSKRLDEIGVDHGVMQANHWRTDPRKPVQVATIQTLTRRDFPAAKVVIFDEAHLSISNSFNTVAEHYKDGIVLGLTATPIRQDGKGLGRLYEEMIVVTEPSTLIQRGRLARPRHFAPYLPQLGGVRIAGGDYAADDLEKIMAQQALMGDIVDQWFKHANGRQTVVFACSVNHSKMIVNKFKANGITAEHIDGETPMPVREQIYERVRRRETMVISNCAVLCEGFDLPAISCVILARPTQSLALYLQQAGRGLRTAPGKEDCIILDHAGCGIAHDMIDAHRNWSLDDKAKMGRKGKSEPTINIAACKECFTMFKRDEGKCPTCGTVLETQSNDNRLLREDGELVELSEQQKALISAQRKAENRSAKTEADLIALGKERGYKNPVFWAKKILEVRGKRHATHS